MEKIADSVFTSEFTLGLDGTWNTILGAYILFTKINCDL